MTKACLLICIVFFSTSNAEEEELGVAKNAKALASYLIPSLQITDDTSFSVAVNFLNNHILRSADPPPPRSWKIYLENFSDADLKKKVVVIGEDLPLYQVLGQLAEQTGAELVVNQKGYVLRKIYASGEN